MIQRVLVAPLNASHRQRGQIEAFQAVFGADNVRELDWVALERQGNNPGAELAEIARHWKPDWIWMQLQGSEAVAPFYLDRIKADVPGAYITHWMGDCRRVVPEALAETCRRTHATLLSNVGQIEMYQTAGAPRVHYVQIGLDPEDLETGGWEPPFAVPDVVFIGNFYGNAFPEGSAQRLAAIRYLVERGFPIGVVGQGWPKDIPVVGTCHVKQQCAIYRRAKVCLSISHFSDINRYYSDRLLISLASGTPVLARYCPGLELEFLNGSEFLWWHGHGDLTPQLAKLLDDPDLRHRIGMAGMKRVVGEHTWKSRIQNLVPLISAWRDNMVRSQR